MWEKIEKYSHKQFTEWLEVYENKLNHFSDQKKYNLQQ